MLLRWCIAKRENFELSNQYHTYLKGLLKETQLRLKKRLGQHFLSDYDTLLKIAEQFNNTKSDSVIEIGTGIGNLTILLAEKFKNVYTIEIDKRFINLHKKITSQFNNIQFIYADAVRFSYSNLIESESIKNISIGGNIPYSITSPLLFKLLKSRLPFVEIIFLIQEDVARRIVSEPNSKNYGVLSITSQYYGDPSVLFNVSPEKFLPSPQVSSSVLKIKLKDTLPLNQEEEDVFFDIVNASFAQRRKQIVNSIINSKKINLDREYLLECLNSVNIDPKRRAETLSIQEYIKLTKQVMHNIEP